MQKKMLLFFLLIPACSGRAHTKEQALANLKRQAEQMASVTVKYDFEGMADLTHPNLIQIAGGRTKYIELVKRTMNEMAGQGTMVIMECEIREMPSDWVEVKSEYYAIVTTLTRFTGPDNSKLKMKTGLIGVSSDQGRNWKFVAANEKRGIEAIRKVLPNWPDSLILPKFSLPSIDE